MTQQPIEPLLLDDEVCRLFKCGPSTLRTLERNGVLIPVRIGRLVRYRASDVRALLDNDAPSIVDSGNSPESDVTHIEVK